MNAGLPRSGALTRNGLSRDGLSRDGRLSWNGLSRDRGLPRSGRLSRDVRRLCGDGEPLQMRAGGQAGRNGGGRGLLLCSCDRARQRIRLAMWRSYALEPEDLEPAQAKHELADAGSDGARRVQLGELVDRLLDPEGVLLRLVDRRRAGARRAAARRPTLEPSDQRLADRLCSRLESPLGGGVHARPRRPIPMRARRSARRPARRPGRRRVGPLRVELRRSRARARLRAVATRSAAAGEGGRDRDARKRGRGERVRPPRPPKPRSLSRLPSPLRPR